MSLLNCGSKYGVQCRASSNEVSRIQLNLFILPSASELLYAHSTNDMSFPVLPPIFPSCLLIPCAAPLIAGPAEEVTLDRPWEALDCTLEAVSLVLEAALEATSWVEACLRDLWRPTRRVCRSMKRGATADNMIENDLGLNFSVKNGPWRKGRR